MKNLPIHAFGAGGVNLVKNPLQMADDEATQLQNAEWVPDQARGGQSSLSKRGGLAALTAALAGAVTGLVGLPLRTTYTRSLFISLGTAAANTFVKSADGTTFTATASPLRGMDMRMDSGLTYVMGARIANWKNAILYPSGTYTIDNGTPGNNTAQPMNYYNGTDSAALFTLSRGFDTNFPKGVTDMIVANGKIYFGVYDESGGNSEGRVMSLDPQTGEVKQIANAFGDLTGGMTGGYPAVLCWYQGQLWAGLNNNSGSSGAGKVVRCYPDVDAAWTSDVATLDGDVGSLAVYKGQLYAGCRGGSIGVNTRVKVRSASAGTWATSDDNAATGVGYAAALTVFGTDLYYVLYEGGGTFDMKIRKFDGASWTTDRDVGGVAQDTNNNANLPVNGIVFGGALYFSFIATTLTATDGFVLKRTSGAVYTSAYTGNVRGSMGILTEVS